VFGHSATGNFPGNAPPKTNAKVPALTTMEFIFGEHLCIIRDHLELSIEAG
jgi:hypothetical protein